MATVIETTLRKRGAILLFSNLKHQDAFYFISDKKKTPYRYLRYEDGFNYYVDSGMYLSAGKAYEKRTKKNLQIVFLQENQ